MFCVLFLFCFLYVASAIAAVALAITNASLAAASLAAASLAAAVLRLCSLAYILRCVRVCAYVC